MVERQTSMDEFLKNYNEQVQEDKEVVTSGEYEEELRSRLSVIEALTLVTSSKATKAVLKVSTAKHVVRVTSDW